MPSRSSTNDKQRTTIPVANGELMAIRPNKTVTRKIAFPDEWIASIFAVFFSRPHNLGFHCVQTSLRVLSRDIEMPPLSHRNRRTRHRNPGPEDTGWRTQPTTNRVSRTVGPVSEVLLSLHYMVELACGRWLVATAPTPTTCHRPQYK